MFFRPAKIGGSKVANRDAWGLDVSPGGMSWLYGKLFRPKQPNDEGSHPPGTSQRASPSSTTRPPSRSSIGANAAAQQRYANRNDCTGMRVFVHVYDLRDYFASLNTATTMTLSLGAFHAGVEVDGKEYSYGCGPSGMTGVRYCEPRGMPCHHYRTTVDMGTTKLGRAEVAKPAFQYYALLLLSIFGVMEESHRK